MLGMCRLERCHQVCTRERWKHRHSDYQVPLVISWLRDDLLLFPTMPKSWQSYTNPRVGQLLQSGFLKPKEHPRLATQPASQDICDWVSVYPWLWASHSNGMGDASSCQEMLFTVAHKCILTQPLPNKTVNNFKSTISLLIEIRNYVHTHFKQAPK